MSNFGWTIKVSDLLRHIGSQDTVSFHEKIVDDDSMTILPPGVSGSLSLLSLNDTTIQLTIHNLTCVVLDVSDISGEEFTRDVQLDEYEVLYTLPQETLDIDEIYSSFSDVYEIDPKDLCIDISTCIVNAIRSQEPIVKRKHDEELSDCAINDDNRNDEDI